MLVNHNLSIDTFPFSALDKIVVNGYKALQLIYFFTCGKDEVKAWTIQVYHHIEGHSYLHP